MLDFLPAESYLQSGIYNKYYAHYQPNDRNNWSTEQNYVFQQKRDDVLKVQFMNAAYEPTYNQVLDISEENWVKKSEFIYTRTGDTIVSEFLSPHILRFNQDSVPPIEMTANYPDGGIYYEYREYLPPRDTIIENRSGKIINARGYRQFTNATDTTKFDYTYLAVYLDELGLYYSRLKTAEYAFILELVEQIPEREFRKLLTNKPKRVAYINPNETLDRNPLFETCGEINDIVDYYNGDPDGRPVGGKRVIENKTKELWDFPERPDASGYLTIRFVINCRGEVGRFVAEQADLNFNAKVFDSDLVQRARQIVESIPAWQVAIIRSEEKDSYAYITFKLQDGQVFDILP